MQASPPIGVLPAEAPGGEHRMKFRFKDVDRDGTLSSPDDFIDIVTFTAATGDTPKVTWRVQPKTPIERPVLPLAPPTAESVREITGGQSTWVPSSTIPPRRGCSDGP